MQRLSLRLSMAIALLWLTALATGQEALPTPDLTQQPTLYVVAYSHLDTQWRWTYPQVIREMIAKTMVDNFRLIDQYPHYIFNFSGANRYRMMQEYYPADYEQVKRYVAAGRWFPCGSSWEECDVNVPGAESIIRQVLYGNRFFRHEFDRTSAEFMLPDCFGFPASLPSILAHCGLRGFSTQKLSWGSAVGIPFNVGFWEGLDGTGLIAALNADKYDGDLQEDLSASPAWLKRLEEDRQKSGLSVDYHYYGTGDEGGAPKEDSVKWLEKCVAGTGPVRVLSTTAEQMFLDIPAASMSHLPRYQGDLLLTEHSAGSITSAAYMKRWNRQNELLADAAERAAVLAEWLGGPAYPRPRLNAAWGLVLGGQFHDILPGTSHPQAYVYSWNDEILAMNQFANVLDSSVGAIAAGMNTQAEGIPLVVYNPLSISREDVVEARVTFPGAPPQAVHVHAPNGEVPSQVVGVDKGTLRVLFLATVPSVGFAVYDVRPAEAAAVAASDLKVSEASLENARYRVTLDANGDVASLFDKLAGHEMLSATARLAFLYDKPRNWPAWNMDWTDRQKPPIAYVEGPAQVRIVERGPVRVALEITRESQGSRFVQTIRLAAGQAGDRIEFFNTIDWQSRECSLKAVYPLAVANPLATYNWEVGIIQRGNNDPKKYEVPAHQWFDLTDTNGDYGVTVLSDCKYGSDKPDDQSLRLTLLRTPGVHGEYQDQGTQDWGRHEILYGLAGHAGDWRQGQTDWQALRLQQPPIAFQTTSHPGSLARSLSLLSVNNPRVRVMAVKKAEDSDECIVRLVELDGQPAKDVHVTSLMPIVAAREVNGQEQPLGAAREADGQLVTDLDRYRLRTFALKLGPSPGRLPAARIQTVPLAYDRCVSSHDGQKAVGGFDSDGRCLPAEMLPAEIAYHGISFKLGSLAEGQPNAVTCRGQEIALSPGNFDRLYLLAAATNGEHQSIFNLDGQPAELNIQDWSGYIGQWDSRIWEGKVEEMAFTWPNKLAGLRPAYIRPAPVAWFCSHRHTANGQNEPYAYCYLFAYALDLKPETKTLTLPNDEQVFIMAATVASDPTVGTHPAQPLLDELKRDDIPVPRIVPAGGSFTDSTSVTLERPLFGGGSSLRYTLDGSDPQPDSAQYAAPILLTTNTVVKARLIDPSGHVGGAAEATFQIRDETPPQVLEIVVAPWSTDIDIKFSEPLDKATAENAPNYALSSGPHVESAALAPDGRSVTLTLAASLTERSDPTHVGGLAVLEINGVRDRSPGGNALAGARHKISVLQPVVQVREARLDGAGGGSVDQKLDPDGPMTGSAAWTINFWLRVDKQPDDYTIIAGFGSGKDRTATQRYLAKFPHGLHFWGSNVDVPARVALDVGRWQMITATFDGYLLRLFKDGRESATQEIALEDAAALARLGPPPPWPHGHQLAGQVDGFTLWSRALSSKSIAELQRLGQAAFP